MKIFLLCVSLSFLIILPGTIFATENVSNQFVTVANPIRISTYSTDPGASLAAQYGEVQKRNLAATWLLTYDAISDPGIVSAALAMDKNQELGLFLEVTPKFATESGTIYNKTDSWHRANSVFLSGYTQQDRIRLIDAIFEKFKQIFGFYPVSVGAWWLDSYSLDYMKSKFNIVANLTVSDQFATDGYQVWGQYWSTPFYPSKIHSGIPANTYDYKLDIVTIQWAARDPLNGYGRGPASLFSTQDYFNIEYFEKLVDLYAKSHGNKFGQITVGLEGDFPPSSYSGFFSSQLDVVKKVKENDGVSVVTMEEFSNWYRNNFPELSPVHAIQTDDFLGKRIRTIWYNSPNFRINIVYNYDAKKTIIRDFRTYHDNFQEPYYISPNRDLNLSINLPSQLDSASNPEEEWNILDKELEEVNLSDEMLTLSYKDDVQIRFTQDKIEIFGDIKDIPKSLTISPLVTFKKEGKRLYISPQVNWNFPKEGLIFRSLTQEGTFFLRQRKVILLQILVIVFLITTGIFITRRKVKTSYKIFTIGGLLLVVFTGSFLWYLSNSRLYFVNSAELDALNRLKAMPGKKVVIYDKVCLQCSWHTSLMPAIFANKRGYVKQISGKEIIYNSSIFNAKTRPEAKKELDKLNADYIYLVRFEDYVELAPFSPGDLNIEEIYSNANTQIWKVKKS